MSGSHPVGSLSPRFPARALPWIRASGEGGAGPAGPRDDRTCTSDAFRSPRPRRRRRRRRWPARASREPRIRPRRLHSLAAECGGRANSASPLRGDYAAAISIGREFASVNEGGEGKAAEGGGGDRGGGEA